MLKPSELRTPIKADKFFPPQVDTPRFLLRERIVNQLLNRNASGIKSIVIEAQAGQGKSTLIKQYLDRIEIPSVWYQVNSEDTDPAFFLKSVQTCITSIYPAFPVTASSAGIRGRECSLFDLLKEADLFLKGLGSFLKNDHYMVFDDLHFLLSSESGLAILKKLLEAAPAKLHFILSSREPLPIGQWGGEVGSSIYISNQDLALDKSEIAEFFHQVFHLDVSHETVDEICQATDGWIMGVALFGLKMKKQPLHFPVTKLFKPGGDSHREILDYFRREIFSPLERPLQRPLLILSLLEEIHLDLAVELTCQRQIGADLIGLAGRNIFIRSLDLKNETFALHHLFRQFLYEKALAELEPETVRDVFKRAGRYCLAREDAPQGLRYLLRAGEYDIIESVLKDIGMSFLETNQTATLHAILQQIPEPCLQDRGWCLFFLALAKLDSAPAQALPHLQKALQVFSAQSDEVGELLSLSHLISIHITTTGHYRQGEELLKKADALFSRVHEALDTSTTILIARSLAMGHCIFLADTETATRYAATALSLARNKSLVNFEATLLMVMGYIEIFAGHHTRARGFLEEAAPFLHLVEVGTFNCLSIRMMQFNFLFHEGDFRNYFEQKNQLVEAYGNTLFFQSIAGPFCYVWEMDIAINQGCYEKALALADQALAAQPPLSPHLCSQLVQLRAVVLSLCGDSEKALAAAEESQRLRDLSGGLYFMTLNMLLAGACHCRGGKRAQGLELLSRGIEDARKMPTEYLEACGLLHRAVAFLDAGMEGPAKADIVTGMKLMRRNTYRHFWAWDPESMEKVLCFAVAHDIEADYACSLAAERLGLSLLDDGTAIPLLDIQSLGGFKISCRGTTLLQAEDLTPLKRELLYLLLASPELKLPQEIIQLYFWPDSSPAAVKMNFDALVSRLRKISSDILPKGTAHLYLKREKGILWLAHCRVDALDFFDGVNRGLNHYSLQEFWQAGNAFSSAEALWAGSFATEVVGEDLIHTFRETLAGAMTEMAFSWCDLLVKEQRLPKAIQVAEKAIKNDPLNDHLYGLLYKLQGQHSSFQARQVLKRFAETLKAEGYAADEIKELVAEISDER